MDNSAKYLSRPRDLAAAAIQKDNPFADIAVMQRQIATILQYIHSYPTASAATVDGNMGTFTAGEIIMGSTGGFPGDGQFSGLYLTADQIEFPAESGQFWNFIGLNNDVLQVGIDALTGRLLAAGGALVIDQNAMTLTGLGYAMVQTATDGANTRTMRYGMTEVDGLTIPVGQILYTAPAGTNVIANNPSFETGTFANWTATNAGGAVWSVSSAQAEDGIYSALCTEGGGFGIPTLESDKYTVAPSTNYLASGWVFYSGDSTNKPGIAINWYTSGNVLISTNFLNGFITNNAWSQQLGSFLSPSNAAKATIYIQDHNGNAGILTYFDNVSLSAQTTTSSMLFKPYVTIMGPLEMPVPVGVTPFTAPTAPYSQMYLSNVGVVFNSPSGVGTNGTIRKTDVQAFVSGSGGNYTLPDGVQHVMILAVGGGGGGGGGRGRAAGALRTGGGGGGGGAVACMTISAGRLVGLSPITVTLGQGGSGGTGGTNADGTAGGAGGNTSFGNIVTAFGGGGGGPGTGTAAVQGGTGGGTGGAGATAPHANIGGSPSTASSPGIGGGGASQGSSAEWGGGGGGVAQTTVGASAPGGGSIFGAAGGGAGAGFTAANAAILSTAGGFSATYSVGTGNAGGTNGTNGNPGIGATNGGADSPNGMGAGAGGGGGGTNGTGGGGGDGGAPAGSSSGNPIQGGGGGGGGGGGAATGVANKAGNGGSGGRGSCIVISW